MDADSIPLKLVLTWQKALFLSQWNGRARAASLTVVSLLSLETPPSADKAGGVFISAKESFLGSEQ